MLSTMVCSSLQRYEKTLNLSIVKTTPNYIVFNSRDELLKVNLDRVVYFEA